MFARLQIMRKINFILLQLIALLIFSSSGFSLEKPAEELNEVGIDFLLGNQIDLELQFTDIKGEKVLLKDSVQGKPTIFVPVYYNCPRLCGLVLKGVEKMLPGLNLEEGEEYRIVTFSFDPENTTEMAAKRASEYKTASGVPASESPNWSFLTGEKPQIDSLLGQLGFKVKKDNTEYAHTGAIILLTAEGKISQYFTGIEFSPWDVKLALIEASQGQIGSALDHVLLFCFRFDPTKGKYTWAAFNVMRAGGAVTLLLLVFLFWNLMRQEKRKQKS